MSQRNEVEDRWLVDISRKCIFFFTVDNVARVLCKVIVPPPHIYQWNYSKMCAIILTSILHHYLITNPLSFKLCPKYWHYSKETSYSLQDQFSSVQSLSHVRLCNTMNCSTPGLLVHHHVPESTQTMFIESVMPSNHLIRCCPLFLLPSIFPNIKVFSNESALRIRWPRYWSFSFNISPSNEHPGLISFRMDWLDLLAVQGTLKSLLQHHSSKH